jgi:hypothetical protein
MWTMVWPAAPPALLRYAREATLEVSITEDVRVTAPPGPDDAPPRPAAWWWLVAGCGALLLAVGVVLAVWWAATRETRTTTYRVLGDLAAIRLDLGDADVEIDGGGAAVEVRRIDRFAYGAPADEDRSVDGGELSISSRCPEQVLGSCSASYRLTVPDNVPLEIQTSSGTSSDSGDISAVSKCSPDRLELRSRSGDVRAVVPAGRYQIDAQSDSGDSRIRGLTDTDDAPFLIQALSTSGDVSVEAAS